MFLFHGCHVVVYLVVGLVVVRFDGSLKVPTIDGRARLATAAATLSCSNHYTCEQVLHMGGKHLDTNRVKTSGEAEFEGLILGLEGLLEHQESLTPFVDGVILVQGDCKTAIQQMQGRSRSRKMTHLCDKANELVQEIPWSLQFEHCPREQNVLCDRLCYGILAFKQEFVVDHISSSLLRMLKDDVIKTESLQELHEKFLLPGKTMLNGTSRAKLYSIIAKMAWLQSDYKFLLEIGGRIQTLADALRSRESRRSDTDDAILLQLKVEGIKYEMAALHMTGKEKEALKVKRREKRILLRHCGDGGKNSIDSVLANPVVEERSVAIPSLESAIFEWATESKENPLDMDQLLIQCGSIASLPNFNGDEDTSHPLASAIRHLLRQPSLAAEPVPTWVPVHLFNSGP